MPSFREQLKQGSFVSETEVSLPYMNKTIHKLTGICTTSSEGFCQFDFAETGNHFLLKRSRNDSKGCNGVLR